jgi:Bacterial membrane protein YfhO
MKQIAKVLLQRAIPHVLAVVVFVTVAVVYCKPVFDDKVLEQEDVLQWQGMAHNSFQYKETHGHFPLWSNGMFSGMPAYQIAMDPQSVSIPDLFYGPITLWLKKPASFFFLACICFYFLCIVLRVNPWVGIIGALAYAYCTYNPVIVAVGHDTKMQSIAILPGAIAGLILIFEQKYWLGMVLTAFFTALLISFNHIQIVYYTMLIVGGLAVGYAIPWLRRGETRMLLRTFLLAAGAALIGILSNAVALFTTFDSSKETIRGGSELADQQSNYTSDGLGATSAFDFSMYKLEPFVMFVPDIYGGSTDLQLPSGRSRAVQSLQKMPHELAAQIGTDGPRYYWGGVGEFFSGPPYVGAIVILLALAGFFILDNKHKWWILGLTILTIVMSWGGYFRAFNGLLLKYLPMYNKFRAPSMILVVPTFLFCVMAVLTLQRILADRTKSSTPGGIEPSVGDRTNPSLWRRWLWGLAAITTIFLVLGVLYFRFDYASTWENDLLITTRHKGPTAVAYMQDFVRGLRADRQQLFGQSILRSLLLVTAAALTISLFIRRRIRPAFMLIVIGVLIFSDVMSIDVNYLNNDNYKGKDEYEENFAATEADKTISQDKGYYRVFDLRENMSNALTYGAMTAYFHNSIGGYHAARLKIYEDLINRQLFNFPNCIPVLNMLNTKYIIRPAHNGGDSVIRNQGSLGPVWFVRSVRFEPTAKDVMNALTRLNPKDTAVVFSADSATVAFDAVPDTSGAIQLLKNDNDELTYLSESRNRRFAVFSEVFYKRGWRAFVDDKEVPIIRTNYVLRGLSLPAGRHIVRFFFRPLAYYLGRQMQWMASIIFLMMVAGAIITALRDYFPFRRLSSQKKCEPLSSA